MEADGARHSQLRTPVPIVEEAGLDPGLVCTGVEKISCSRQVSNPVQSNPHGESLYRPLLFNVPKYINYRVYKIPPLDSILSNSVLSTHVLFT